LAEKRGEKPVKASPEYEALKKLWISSGKAEKKPK
jgi:hypothetical protein